MALDGRVFEPGDTPALAPVYQTHEVARWLYRRILEDPQLLQHVKTDADIEAFQALPRKEKRDLLGTRPDFEATRLRIDLSIRRTTSRRS